MRPTPASPFGGRLRKPGTVKIKGLQVVHKSSDTPDSSGAQWGSMWANFDWAGWLKPQIDLAAAHGANLVKITGSGATATYPDQTTFHARIEQFIAYARTQRLRVYWNYAARDWGGDVATATPFLQDVAALVGRHPNVVALDVANEAGLAGATVAQAAQLVGVARDACTLPLTASLSVDGRAAFTGSGAATLGPVVDFLDFHPYYSSGDPQDSDLDTFRAQSWYKPYLIGECGLALSAGTAAQTSRWQSLGALSSASSDCYGSVGFCITDYDGTQQFGMYAADLTTERTQISTPFAAWPAAW